MHIQIRKLNGDLNHVYGVHINNENRIDTLVKHRFLVLSEKAILQYNIYLVAKCRDL